MPAITFHFLILSVCLCFYLGGCTSSYFSIRDAIVQPEFSAKQITGRARTEIENEYGIPTSTATSSKQQVTCRYEYKARKKYPSWAFSDGNGIVGPIVKETIFFPFYVVLDLFEPDCFQVTVVYNDQAIAISEFRRPIDCKSHRSSFPKQKLQKVPM